jgi:hypothetical protein
MRLKIIAGNLVAVLLLGLVSYMLVGADLEKVLSNRVRAQIGNDQVLIDRSLRLTALEFVNLVKSRASDGDVKAVFGALDEEGRRTRAFEAAERSSAWFGDPARGARGRPDIIVFTDDSGKVLARNADRNRMYGMKLDASVAAVRRTLQDGEARHDVWKKDDEGKLLELAVAAVRSEEGTLVGALVVGYDYSNGFAKREGKLLGGRDVAFLVDDKVYSSSLDETVAKQLRNHAFGPAKADVTAAYAGSPSNVWTLKLGGDDYFGAVGQLPEAPSAKVAYGVLANRSELVADAKSPIKVILTLMIVCALVVVGYGFMIGNQIVRPVEQMEEGVLAAINGNTSLRLDTASPDFGGLAYRINQLLNVMTGVSEGESEDEQGRTGVNQEAWKDSAFADGGAAPAGGGSAAAPSTEPLDDPALATKLSAEPEDAYYRRVFSEYVAAKKAVGESVPMPEDRFTQRLRGNEQALIKKHGVRNVRFQVQKSGGQVVLQPVLIR